LKSKLSNGDKKPGGKFKDTETFLIKHSLAADILANKKNNQINFVLGSYKFVLSEEITCTLRQMLHSNL